MSTKAVGLHIDTTQGFPLERIASLQPDVILATNTAPPIEQSWDQLNEIAPVVGHVEAPGVDSWQQGVRQIGAALGRAERAEQLITETEGLTTQAREAHPEFAGQRVSIFNYVANDGLYVINDDSDFSIRFFRELGFAGVPDAVAELPGQSGRAHVSAERYSLLDADVIVGTSPDPAALEELGNHELFARVPAVARGSYLPIGIGPATAMAFPSVLSVPYAVDELVPQLSDAVNRR